MNKLVLFLIIFLGLLAPVFFVSAATSGYAWSVNAGWINFGCDHCNVQVTGNAITGYAWSENYGYINLSPTDSGVKNDGSGNLSGDAWGANTGWINFSGTIINSSGKFTGTATGNVVGTINFDCTSSQFNCNVATTDWTPSSSSSVCGDGICNGSETCSTCPADCGSCGGGGGGGCSNSSSCGTNGYTGSLFCQNGDVYQNYTTYACNNGACSNSSAAQLKTSCHPNLVCSNGACVACSANIDCGTNNYIDSSFCQNGSVYQNYTTYTCNNPGVSNASCSNSTTTQLETICSSGQICDSGSCVNQNIACSSDSDCGTDAYTGSPSCQNGNVYQSYITYTCSNPGTVSSFCSNSTAVQLETTCAAGQVCDYGNCVNPEIACTLDTDCGTDGYTDSPFCQNGNVYQNYTTYTCNDSGMADSSCLNSATTKLEATCAAGQVCSSGSCVNQNKKHNECNNSQCVSVDGIGIDQCNSNNDCQVLKHNECNFQQQCVAVSGEGSNQCQTSGDCTNGAAGGGGSGGSGSGGGVSGVVGNIINGTTVKKIITESAKTIETATKAVEKQIPEPVKVAAQQTKKIVNSPQGSAVTKTVSTTGVVVATVATASSFATFPFLEIFLIPLRLAGLLLTALGLKKKFLPWGVVYDSVTKRPLDPAYVILKNLQGGTVSSAITDLDGRYGFLVGPGVYQMRAHKTNYNFPSQKLTGRTHDELYADLYFGENINIKTAGEVIVKNIPLDPVKFDWNEFAKKNKNLMRFYSKWDIIIRKTYDYFFVIGFIVAIIAYVFAPYPYNAVIIGLYLILLLLRILGLKPKSYGHIIDKDTGNPLSFAIVRIIVPGSNTEITSKSADKYGKYYCLVPPGKYYLKIERKNANGSYSLVHTSSIIDVSHKGIIKETFKI